MTMMMMMMLMTGTKTTTTNNVISGFVGYDVTIRKWQRFGGILITPLFKIK